MSSANRIIAPLATSMMLMVCSMAQAATVSETVITATRVERQIFETPHAVTVMNDEEIEEANVSRTPDLFQYAEGVYIQNTNFGGGSPFIRGLTGKQVLILVDGVRVNNSFFRFGPHQYLNTIDPNIVERIEVVRGPASVLYGSDALGGVINIVTKSREDYSQSRAVDGLLQGTVGSAADSAMLRAQVSGNRDNLGFIGGISYKDYDDLEGGGNAGDQDPSGYDEMGADLKANLALPNGHELVFAQQYLKQNDVPKTSEVTLGSKLQFNYEPQERSLTYLEYRTQAIGPFDAVKANVSYNRLKEGEEIIDAATPTTETRELTDVKTKGALLQATKKINQRHRLTTGFEYYRDDYDTRKKSIDLTTGGSTAIAPGTPDGATYESLGIYLQDEFAVNARLDAVVGIRYSKFETDGELDHPTEGRQTLSLDTDKFTGSINALYRLTPTLNVVGGLAQGFRAPSMEDFFGRVDFFSEIPNTDLDPEESFSRELGLKFYNGNTSAEFFVHETDYDGLIDRTTVGTNPDGSPIKQRRNITDATIRGAELAVDHTFNKNWQAGGNIVWTWGKDRDTDSPLRRIPPLNGSVRVRHNRTMKHWVEGALVFAKHQDRLSSGDIDDARIPPGGTRGYGVVHVKSGYQIDKRQEVILTLENIGDKRYKTHGSGLFAPGRSAILTYRLELD